MRNKIGTIFMALGTVLILAALSLFYMNLREARQAGDSVEEVLPQIREQIHGQTVSDETTKEYHNLYGIEMTEVEINGYSYIGYLSLPSIGLELPVMSHWDYARLKISPCRYIGSTKTDNLVILAHNYTQHFGMLSKLSEGDAVTFTDMDGVVFQYEVVAMDILSPTDVEQMASDDYDLTLFTCTYGGKSRITVRCEKTEARKSK